MRYRFSPAALALATLSANARDDARDPRIAAAVAAAAVVTEHESKVRRESTRVGVGHMRVSLGRLVEMNGTAQVARLLDARRAI